MGYRTWIIKVNDRSIQAKMSKDHAEWIKGRLLPLANIRQHHREITNYSGEDHTTVLWSPFGGAAELADEQGFAADMAAFWQSVPALVTDENYKPMLEQAAAIFAKHCPVIDKRESAEDKAARLATIKANEDKLAEEANAFRAKYGHSENLVPIPEGMMGVYLSVNFDDSDSMTDYFNNHCSIGPDMLLAIVPKQAETERLARSVVARYPELAAHSWTWDTAKYSMGHENWLQSEKIGTEKRHAYDGRPEVGVWFEVEFSHGTKQMHTAKGYPGNVGATIAPPEKPSEGVIVRRNEAHNGIEVVFAAKPDDATMDRLKRWGFRWSRYQGLWYRHYNGPLFDEVQAALCPASEPPAEPSAVNTALTLQGTASGSSEVPAPLPDPENDTAERCENCHYSECDYATKAADNMGFVNSCDAWAPRAGSAAEAAITQALAIVPEVSPC